MSVSVVLGAAAAGSGLASAPVTTVPLTLTGVVGDGAVAVYDTFALPGVVNATQGTATLLFTLPPPFTSANTYVEIINNAVNPGTGTFILAWLLPTVETDTVNHVWTATGRAEIPAGTYQALVHSVFSDGGGVYTAADWNFTVTLTNGGPSTATLPLAGAIGQNKTVQVAANTLPTSSTVRYVAPAGYSLSGAQVTASYYFPADQWGTTCSQPGQCLTNSGLNTVVGTGGSSIDVTVPSLSSLKAALGNPASPTPSIKLYVDIDVNNPTANLQHITFKFSTTFTDIAGAGGDGGPGDGIVGRLAAADRFGTAVAVSHAEFPTGGAAAVVLARGDDYPDALVGTPFAAAKHAPLLLTAGTTLPVTTETEIQRVLAPGGTVYILGGTGAIPASVAGELSGLGYQVTRYGGANRYATAVQVADALGDPTTVLLATGTNFPDALSAGVAAAKSGGVVLLTDGVRLPTETNAYLVTHGTNVYAIGGPAAAADTTATAIVGADRYATSVDVAQKFFSAPTTVGIATGSAFPDALSGGALYAHIGAPLLLAAPTSLPPIVTSYLNSIKTSAATAQLFGGTSALAATVQTAVSAALGK